MLKITEFLVVSAVLFIVFYLLNPHFIPNFLSLSLSPSLEAVSCCR